MTTPRAPWHADDESLVDLRCSVVVIKNDRFLLIRRGDLAADWVLPGGRPRQGESMQSCAQRETFEETGLRVNPTRCAFVGEVIAPDDGDRVVELVFLAEVSNADADSLGTGEPGTTPSWVPADKLPELHLQPPIAGFLPALLRGRRGTAMYLGNLWRSPRELSQVEDPT
jgi:ADP-ribose pyrophosphatase YjhB (NUDIX family)